MCGTLLTLASVVTVAGADADVRPLAPASRLLASDVGGLDDRGPEREFGSHHRGQLFGCRTRSLDAEHLVAGNREQRSENRKTCQARAASICHLSSVL